MEIEYDDNQNEEKESRVGEDYNEVFLATCYKKDDRLLFVQSGKLVMGINIKGGFVIQAHQNLNLYKNLKKISKLEVKAILEAN